MARIPRINLLAGWYHCINRGVGKNTIFFDQEDYQGFADDVANIAKPYSIDLAAFCLMPNHWHIVLYCNDSRLMSEFFRKILNNHTRRHHTKYRTIGHGSIYQGRFKSFLIKDELVLNTICEYVLQNPLRADLVTKIEEWPWTFYKQWGQSRD